MPFCRVAGPLRFSVGFPRHGSRIPGSLGLAEWPSGLGKGLQSPVHGFDSRLRLAGSRAVSSVGERFPDIRIGPELNSSSSAGGRGDNFIARHWFGQWFGSQERA